MKIRLNKGWWKLVFKRRVVNQGEDLYGICYAKTRRIEVATEDVSEQELLDTIIHELLHGADTSKAEWWIKRTARDISKTLWRLGYRRPRE